MSALANHSFAKMNGIGNEIVVVDLRDAPGKVSAAEARAVAAAAHARISVASVSGRVIA